MSLLTSNRSRHAAGFTLVELMVALVVFTIGLVGLGLLITSAVRSNHVGMMHTQATFVVDSLLDRMRANIQGVWAGNYGGTFNAATAPPGTACAAGTFCGPAALAARDTGAWAQMLTQMLPNGSGVVLCTRRVGTLVPSAEVMLSAPAYDGTCSVTLSWSELGEGQGGARTESYQWVVQP